MATVPKRRSTERQPLPTLAQLRQSPNEFLDKLDIAVLNLLCASGLPGAENLPIRELLDWIDDAARIVQKETEANYEHFLASPGAFGFSQAKFCMLNLVTVLQRKLGVRYHSKWQDVVPEKETPREFSLDADALFIHSIINGTGGTCGSLPVLYIAVGRRLGYPLKLVKAFRHLFIRWDDPNGKHRFHPDQFNVEATGPGVHFLPDDHYRIWPHKISGEDMQAGIFLKSLSASEELAEFLAARGYCLRGHRRWEEAIEVFTAAAKLAPHNHYFERSRSGLMMYLEMLRRGHAFLDAPVAQPRTATSDWPAGPHWIIDSVGRDVLIQIPRSGHYQPFPFGVTRWPLVPASVQLPNGQIAGAHVPVHGSGTPALQADWIKLTGGAYALIHRPVQHSWHHPMQPHFGHRNGQPVLPADGPAHFIQATDSMRPYEQAAIVAAIEQLREPPHVRLANQHGNRIHAIALPPRPNRPALPPGIMLPSK